MEPVGEYNAQPEEPTEAVATEEQSPAVDVLKLTKQMEQLQGIFQEQLVKSVELTKELTQVKQNLHSILREKLEAEKEISSRISDEEGEQKPVSILLRYKAPSPKLRKEILAIQVAHTEDYGRLRDSYIAHGMEQEWFEIDTDNLSSAQQLMLMRYKQELSEQSMLYQLMYFKAIIDDSQLLTEQKAWVRGGVDSEFYQNIDYGEVEKAVISFRLYYDLR